MTGPQAVILGLVQGVTEFLPISSSAHLILTSFFLGWEDQGLYFDIAVHLGSMLAVILFLRREVAALVRSLRIGDAGEEAKADDARLALALAVGTFPVAIGGLLIREFVETTGRQPVLIAITSIVFGVELLVADRKGSKSARLSEIGWRDGLLIGLGQDLALVPGTSRAGITMTVALALGYDRVSAARFSFLLAIPVSFLVGAKQLLDIPLLASNGIDLGEFLVGFVVSGLAAYLAIGFLVNWVKQKDYSVFVAYRVVFGLVILVSVWH